jgi:hypothetical protein
MQIKYGGWETVLHTPVRKIRRSVYAEKKTGGFEFTG